MLSRITKERRKCGIKKNDKQNFEGKKWEKDMKTYSLSFAVLVHEFLELSASFDLEENFVVVLEK